jgi:hypothetical protein
MVAEKPPCSNHRVVHVFVFGGVSMRAVSITVRLRRSSIVGVAVGSFDLDASVKANTFAFLGQYEKVLPCTDVAFARHYSLGS